MDLARPRPMKLALLLVLALGASLMVTPADAAPPPPVPPASPVGAMDPDCLTEAALAGDADAAWACLNEAVPAPYDIGAELQSLLPKPPCAETEINDRCPGWGMTWSNEETPENSFQFPSGMALSPDDSVIYVALTDQVGAGWDTTSWWTILALDSTDGTTLWRTSWGDRSRYSFPSDLAVGPDGTIYVTGTTRESNTAPDGTVLTMAFDPVDGATGWSSTYRGPGNGVDNGRKIVVAPDGSSVYVAAVSDGDPNGYDLDYAILGIDTASGDQQWAYRYAGIGQGLTDSPFDLAIHPRGEHVYATGWSGGLGEFNVDYGTIAVTATGPDAGALAWEARYDGTNTRGPDQAYGIATSPDGKTVAVTGLSHDARSGPPFPVDYKMGTVVYDSSSGVQLWEGRKGWDGVAHNLGTSLDIDGAGRVFVSGQSSGGSPSRTMFGVVAYDSNGTEMWSERHGTREHDFELPKDTLVSPDGSQVYVTGVSSSSESRNLFLGQGQSGDQLTLAYAADDGALDWRARWNDTGYDMAVGSKLVGSRDGDSLYVASAVTHNIEFKSNFYDLGLTAYSLDGSPGPWREPTQVAFTQDSGITGQYSDETFFEAALTGRSGSSLQGEEVVFTLGEGTDARRFPATTDEEGIASVTPRLIERPGDYPLTVTFEGSAQHQGSEDSTVFTVTREDSATQLSVEGQGVTMTLQARLYDVDTPSSGIAGRTIQFFSDSASLGTATTDVDGVASVPVPPGHRGSNRTYGAVFEGDDYFLGSSASRGRQP